MADNQKTQAVMPSKLFWVRSASFDPHYNLALEELLAQEVAEDEWLLYLWRNEKTVVIGRNQNAWRECAVEALRADGGNLARRHSGGGAVYQDLGNLNFTFICAKQAYDLSRNIEVVCEAVRSFGINAQLTGRNDITVDGAKFSGNAFSQNAHMQVHHGTLMVDVNTDSLARYLRPDIRKLKAKGISSVRSRVINLKQCDPSLTIEALLDALVAAFDKVGRTQSLPFDMSRIDDTALKKRRDEYASWEWRLGAVRDFSHVLDERFDWGCFELRLQISKGLIKHAEVFSDALDADFIEEFPKVLADCAFLSQEMRDALDRLQPRSDLQTQMLNDVKEYVNRALVGHSLLQMS